MRNQGFKDSARPKFGRLRGLAFLFSIMALLISIGAAFETAHAEVVQDECRPSSITVSANACDVDVLDQTGQQTHIDKGQSATFQSPGPDHIRVFHDGEIDKTIVIGIFTDKGISVEDRAIFETGPWFRDVTFSGIDKIVSVDRPSEGAALFSSARSTPSEDHPEVGDVFTGTCKPTVVEQNGTGGSVTSVIMYAYTGILTEFMGIRCYCSDHTAAAPYVGQSFTYTYTITQVDKKTGKVMGLFYATPTSGATDGVTTDSSGHLTGYQRLSIYAIITREYTGHIRLKKVSMAPSMTGSNSLYSLDGAKYRIYEDKACTTKSEYDDLETEDGSYVKSEAMTAGTYYIKEIKASKGFELSDKVYKVEVVPNETTDVGIDLNGSTVVTEIPRHNPSKFVLGKFDMESSEGWAQGDSSLQDARYGVEYYDAQYTSVSAAQSSGDPKRQWVFKSDASGKINMCNEDYLVNGTLYKDRDGDIMYPIGTYVIYETKPSEGYLLSDEKVLIRISKDPDGDETIFRGNVVKGSSLPSSNTTYASYANVVIVKEPPLKGSLKAEKRDIDTGQIPQGDATLEGTAFEVRNLSKNAVLYAGKKISPGQIICTLSIGPDSTVCQMPLRSLPYGTYSITEKVSGEGYRLSDGAPRQFKISTDGEIVSYLGDDSFKNEPKRAYAIVTKGDSLTPDGLAQGDATLAGTRFQIENISKRAIVYDGMLYEPDTVAVTFESDEYGICPEIELPYGTYRITEIEASEGFLLTDSESREFEVREDGERILIDFANLPMRGSLELEKRDLETGESLPLGAATLEATRFEITNKSKARIFISDIRYDPGDVCAIIYTDSSGMASIARKTLPYGTYSIKETAPSAGYLLTDKEERIFKIREDGEIAFFGKVGSEDHSKQGDAFYNQVMREDLSFQKIRGETSEHMGKIPFEITSKTTGERHVVVTDENGEARTEASWNPHTRNTNGNDDVSEDDIDIYAGVWWGVNANGVIARPNDDLCALVYDDYTFRELPVEANRDYELVEFDISVRRDGYVIDLGTIENNPPSVYPDPAISTNASDGADGDKVAYASKTSVLNDQVSYMNLDPGKEYVMHASLVDAQTLELIEGAEAYKTFRPDTEYGSIVMEIECDTLKIAGGKAVFFEELTENGGIVCTHMDADDPAQTVAISKPEVVTYAHDSHDGDKTVVADASSSITDEVSLVNLEPEIAYTLYGVVVDRATGLPAALSSIEDGSCPTKQEIESFWGKLLEILGTEVIDTEDGISCDMAYGRRIDKDAVSRHLADHPDITSSIDIISKDFVAASQTMTMTMDYPLSASASEGDYVIFDVLLNEDVVVATHADTANDDQSFVMVSPSISTTAMDKTDGDHEMLPSKVARIVDTITYCGLVTSAGYEIHGTLMDKATGKVLYIDDEPVEASMSFTPNSDSGDVDIEFAFDASSLPEGCELVAFESVTKDGEQIARHTDINDEAQTVRISTIAEGDNPVSTAVLGDSYYKTGTGGGKSAFAMAVVALTCACALGIYLANRRKCRLRRHR